jgi:serine/threonine protein kinase
MKVSPDTGIEVDGHEYRLSPHDIELDRDAMLGTGASGVVQAGVHKPTGMRVAVKTVKVDNREKREQMLAEIMGLIQAEGCPYLVQWYAGFVARDTGFINIVVELMDRGSLADLRRRLNGAGLPEDQLACVAAQIVRGLRHLQSRKLLHRDVKPANILVNHAGQVKLTDFGISKDLNSTVGVAATFVGTATYMSPERALGKDYSFQSDIWSAGMVIYELATGQYPFPTNVFLELYECLCVQPEPRLDPARFSPALCDFVERCLTREETRRPDATALLDHEFIAGIGDDHVAAFGYWHESFLSSSTS